MPQSEAENCMRNTVVYGIDFTRYDFLSTIWTGSSSVFHPTHISFLWLAIDKSDSAPESMNAWVLIAHLQFIPIWKELWTCNNHMKMILSDLKNLFPIFHRVLRGQILSLKYGTKYSR